MSKNIVATNIRLPKDELLSYRQIALEEGKSFSEFVRDELSKRVSPSAVSASPRRKKRSLWDIKRYAITAGTTKGSVEHDKDIYGL